LNLEQLISLIYLASGLILIMLAVVILRENPRHRLNRVVATMLAFAGVAPLASAIYKSVLEGIPGLPPWFVNTFYGWELFFPTLLYFSAIFPEPQPVYFTRKRLLQLAFLPHLFHLLLVLLLADPDKVLGVLNFQSGIPLLGEMLRFLSGILRVMTALLGFLLIFHTRFFSLVNFIYVIFAIYFLHLGYSRIDNPRLRQQVKLVIYGIEIAVGLYVIGFIIPEILSFRLSSAVRDATAVAGLIVGPGSIAWAIVRYQFLDVGLIARRSLVYSITTAIVVGGYLLVVVELGSVIRSIIGQQSQVLNVIVVIVLLMFFQPIYTQVDDFVRRIFIRSRGDYSQMVESFSREILSIFQTDRLAAVVADSLQREMFIETVQISLPDSEGKFAWAMPGRQKTASKLEPAIASYLMAKGSPAFTEEFASRAEKEFLGAELHSLGIQLVVPLIRQQNLSGLLLLSGKVAGFRYNSEDLTFLTILANQIVVAMENAELYRDALEKQRLEEELAVAKQIQTGLLPKTLPALRDFDFATFIEPSRQVGGDFYDFIPIRDGRLAVVIADASGKGVPAALLIARMQAVLQSEARLGKNVSQIMASVNRFISESTSPDRFATCFYGELDEHQRRFYYCNAGHNYPLLIRRDGKIEPLAKGGLLLGAFLDAAYEAGEVEFLPGDLLVMYTDGLTEAMNTNEVEYGEERLTEHVSRFRHHPVEMICSKIIKSVKQFASGLSDVDDMTLVVIKAKEEPSA
jgi:sigma-B regulation protein RsbU (phosphoserine phosphatase)